MIWICKVQGEKSWLHFPPNKRSDDYPLRVRGVPGRDPAAGILATAHIYSDWLKPNTLPNTLFYLHIMQFQVQHLNNIHDF